MCTRRNSRPLDKTRQKLDTDTQAGIKREKRGYKGIKHRAKVYNVQTLDRQKTDTGKPPVLFIATRTWWNWQTREPQKLVASQP